MDAFRITFDGASRGNPGPGSSAAVLWQNGARVAQAAKAHPGRVTNNEAEYMGLLLGLQLALDRQVPRLLVAGDSKLVVEQVFGTYACRHPRLQPLNRQAKALAARIGAVQAQWIPRHQNAAADALCNAALDGGAVPSGSPSGGSPSAPSGSPSAPSGSPSAPAGSPILRQLGLM